MKLDEFKKAMKDLKHKYKLSTCCFQYHNKNKTGGNFGYFLRYEEKTSSYVIIHGKYNNEKELMKIQFESSNFRGFQSYEDLGLDPIKHIIDCQFEKK